MYLFVIKMCFMQMNGTVSKNYDRFYSTIWVELSQLFA